MAAPPQKTIHDLTGTWIMNRSLSQNTSEFSAIQGLSWLARKAISAMTISFTLTSCTNDPSPGTESLKIVGMDKKEEALIMDGVWRDKEYTMLGKIEGCATWCSLKDVGGQEEGEGGKWLGSGWIAEGSGEGIRFVTKSESKEWKACAIWGFQMCNGERKLVRKMTISDGKKRVNAMAVYDFSG